MRNHVCVVAQTPHIMVIISALKLPSPPKNGWRVSFQLDADHSAIRPRARIQIPS